MVNINKGKSNTIITSVNQLHTDDDYEIRFNNSGYVDTIKVKDVSTHPIRYNEFEFAEGTDVTLQEGQGEYEIILGGIIVGRGIYFVRGKETSSDVELKDTPEEDIMIN